MSGILWLASYPKSGNTWLRAFLANLLQNPSEPVDINRLSDRQFGDMDVATYERVAGRPLSAMDDAELNRLRPRVHRAIVQASGDTALVKTHNAMAQIDQVPLITPELTQAAIYVLRNPFDVAISYSHHYGVSVDDAIEALGSPAHRIHTTPRSVFQHLGTWSEHARGWKQARGLKLLIIRYEDMRRDPVRAFGRVVRFLGLPKDQPRLRKAIKFSSFDQLSAQESARGFGEKSMHAERFFRSGRAGSWRSELTPEQIDRLVEDHREALREFGYMRPNGKIDT